MILLQPIHIKCPHLYAPILCLPIYLLHIQQQYIESRFCNFITLSFFNVILCFVPGPGHYIIFYCYFYINYGSFGVFYIAQNDDFTYFYFSPLI